jgi:nitroreductase
MELNSMSTEVVSPDVLGKQAETRASVHELIRNRWSPRAFSNRDVSDEDLKAILEAGRWAASSMNEQPWRFLVARKSDGPGYQRMLDVLVPANQEWARYAPVLIMTVAKKNFSRSGAPNHHALHDAGQALAQLMLEVTALGLYSHAMAGYDHEKARKNLAIPDDYDLGAVVAVGYLGNPDQLSEQKRQMEVAKRQRKPLEEVAFGPGWNEPLAL